LFLEAFGDAIEAIVHILDQWSGLLSQQQQIAKVYGMRCVGRFPKIEDKDL
jgi:hypothetical protein